MKIDNKNMRFAGSCRLSLKRKFIEIALAETYENKRDRK